MRTSSALQSSEELLPPAIPVPTRFSLAERVRSLPRSFYWCALGLGLYLVVMRLTSGWRGEQFLGTGLMLFAFFWNDDTRRLGTNLVPLLISVVVYDLTHLTQPYMRFLTIHLTQPYNFEKTVFGLQTANGLVTPNEFFALHHWAAVDFVTGCAYILFLYWSLAFPVLLSFPRRRPELTRLAQQFGWAFMFLNVIGYATYYIYPAAPPWYVATHGWTADFSVLASPAAAVRWDELTGVHYFQHFYGRSADVFGAIPSLHVADPFMVFLYGRALRKRWFNVISFSFYALVCFSAIYLQHHYILDVAIGSAYALIVYRIQQMISARFGSPLPPAVPAGRSQLSPTG